MRGGGQMDGERKKGQKRDIINSCFRMWEWDVSQVSQVWLTFILMDFVQCIFRYGKHTQVRAKFFNKSFYDITCSSSWWYTNAFRGYFLSSILEIESHHTVKFIVLWRIRMFSLVWRRARRSKFTRQVDDHRAGEYINFHLVASGSADSFCICLNFSLLALAIYLDFKLLPSECNAWNTERERERERRKREYETYNEKEQ